MWAWWPKPGSSCLCVKHSTAWAIFLVSRVRALIRGKTGTGEGIEESREWVHFFEKNLEESGIWVIYGSTAMSHRCWSQEDLRFLGKSQRIRTADLSFQKQRGWTNTCTWSKQVAFRVSEFLAMEESQIAFCSGRRHCLYYTGQYRGPSLSSLCGQYTNSLKERSGMKAASTFAGKKDYNVKVCQHFQAQDHGVRGWRLPTRQGSEEVAAAEISSEEVKDPFHEGVKNLGNVCRCSDAHCNASFWEAKTWVRGQPGPHSENNKNEKKFRNTGGMCRIWDHLESGFSLNKRTMI